MARSFKIADEDTKRVQVIWWTLVAVVTISGIAVPGRVLPLVVLVVVLSAFLKSISRARQVLPERVASHFSFALQADGWMGRRVYLTVIGVMAGVIGGVVPLAIYLAAKQAGDAKIQRLALWLMPMLLAMFLGINELTVKANEREPAEMPRLIWALLGAFFVAINLWGLATLLPW